VPKNFVWAPRNGRASIFTALAVETDVLGGTQAVEGLTEPMGVPGSTLSSVSEKAHVVTDVGPPPEQEDDTTQTGRYQAEAVNELPPAGALKSALAVLISVELTSQNMNSYTVPNVPGGFDSWYRYSGAVRATEEPPVTATVPDRPPGRMAPLGNVSELIVMVAAAGLA
jgi:hypothetical protein